MSETLEPSPQPEYYTVSDEHAAPIDYHLDFVLDMLDSGPDGKPGVSDLPLTLSIGGLVVCGSGISRKEWIKRFASKSITGSGGEQLRDFWLKDLAEFKAEDAEREARGLRLLARRFVHLDDATVFSGTQQINVGLWRGRLERLDGWAIGGLPS